MWNLIQDNPDFQAQHGMGMTEEWYNSLPPETQAYLNDQYGQGAQAVADMPTPDVPAPAPVLSLPTPEAPNTPQIEQPQTDNLIPVVINPGTTMAATILYDPTSGAVRSDGSMASNILMSNEVRAQELAKDAYNTSVQSTMGPVLQQERTANAILESSAAGGQPTGAALQQAADARTAVLDQKAIVDASMSNPDAVDVVKSRQSSARQPAYTGLEQFEIDNPNQVQTYQSPQPAPQPVLQTDYIGSHMDRNGVPAAPVDPVSQQIARNQPVLVDTTQPAAPATTGVLQSTGGTTTTTGTMSTSVPAEARVRPAMSTAPMTSNARGSNAPGILADRNEMLIRVGGAMYSGALKGDGIGAATREYGAIQDQNRKAQMEANKMADARRLAEARLRQARAGSSTRSRSGGADTSGMLYNYQRALDAIRESRAQGGDLTGIIGVAKSFVDNFTGDEDAARRLILDRVRVDDALLRVAETKGAVSNTEMALFLKPAPTQWQDEAIWEQWIIDRMEALQRVQNRLDQGIDLRLTQGQPSQTSQPSPGLAQSDLDYINN